MQPACHGCLVTPVDCQLWPWKASQPKRRATRSIEKLILRLGLLVPSNQNITHCVWTIKRPKKQTEHVAFIRFHVQNFLRLRMSTLLSWRTGESFRAKLRQTTENCSLFNLFIPFVKPKPAQSSCAREFVFQEIFRKMSKEDQRAAGHLV